MAGVYLDTSAALRATLEAGMEPEIERRLTAADVLITSRLSLVESSRALIRARELSRISEVQRVDAQRSLESVWARCHVWEITRSICDRASVVAPTTGLRALDAIHFATFLEARLRLGDDIELLTTDERLKGALASR
jgi:predicted nucleic acid-binding protein